MLRSMTGHGAGSIQTDAGTATAEVRAVNGRHFKLTLRASDGFLSLESRVSAVVRRVARRGSITVQIVYDQARPEEDYRIVDAVVRGYYRQVRGLLNDLGDASPVPIDALLGLPGSVEERGASGIDEEAAWALIEPALQGALEKFDEMRIAEGEAMRSELSRQLELIGTELDEVARRAPDVVSSYRERLKQRLAALLAGDPVPVSDADLAREVAMFADRADISEEITRLRSHSAQFRRELDREPGEGKKLDFLLQEMNREANTMAAKANDDRITQGVVEIKAAIERMRELVQNVE